MRIQKSGFKAGGEHLVWPLASTILQVETSVNVGMAILVNLGAGMDLTRVERCEGVKKVVSRNKALIFNFMSLTL